MTDSINIIAQTLKELMSTDELATRLVVQALQTGYTLGLADAKKAG